MSPSAVPSSAASSPLLEVQALEVVYRGRRVWPWKTVGQLRAVSDLSFEIERGQTFALVGESGSGKSTVARAVQGLVPVKAGRITFEHRDVPQLIGRREPVVKQRMQVGVPHPDAARRPRQSLATILDR